MTTKLPMKESTLPPPALPSLAEDVRKEKAITALEEEAVLPVKPTDDSVDEEEGGLDRFTLFHHMVVMPWPYVVVWPVILIFLIGFGWTQEDIIEDEVTNIWIATSGAYARNLDYAKSLGREELGATSFAAMSIARDGGNLFRESRLEEIRARMEKMEKTTVRKDSPFLPNALVTVLSRSS